MLYVSLVHFLQRKAFFLHFSYKKSIFIRESGHYKSKRRRTVELEKRDYMLILWGLIILVPGSKNSRLFNT